jgi:branched-chain amino acid transport system permease protein
MNAEKSPIEKEKRPSGIRRFFSGIPALGWLVGAVAAAILEYYLGDPLADAFGLPKIPVLFGCVIMLKKPLLMPGALMYVLLIYALPVGIISRITSPITNRISLGLSRMPLWFSAVIHLALLYLILRIWADVSDYRLLMLKLSMIAIMLTLSLNVINGYMGEFSCSHPGFMALGAYAASVFTVGLLVNDRLLGQAVLPLSLGHVLFPIALILGGFFAALGALIVAIPSFRTRGDYLAIISLAFMFIVKSLIENLEVVGGPRGMGGQPDLATLPTVFIWCVLCIWTINNFVESTMGKALNAVRDEESAAEAMSVNTRKTKMIAFMFGAFWAGVGGGLFAHVLRYVNPGTFGLKKLAEVLAMVYFGGLNSVIGSIVGAVGFNFLSEMLRPLAIFKWIIIPILLILVMIFRPTGLIAFRRFDVKQILSPRLKSKEEV